MAAIATAAPVPRAAPTRPITEAEVRRHYAAELPECAGHREIEFRTFESCDFDRDGAPEAIVVASTCNSGTGGPDVHDVLRRRKSGGLERLWIEESRTFRGRPIHRWLVPNANFTFSIEGPATSPLLVEHWTDASGRQDPLTVYRRWNGMKFVVVDVRWAKRAAPLRR